MKILDDMLAGVGYTMEEFCSLHGGSNSHQKLPNGCSLSVNGDRRLALRAAFAMGKEGDAIVTLILVLLHSILKSHTFSCLSDAAGCCWQRP